MKRPLTYQGRVIVGECDNCGLAIWGQPADAPRTEHGYCGVTTQVSSRPASVVVVKRATA